MKEKHQFRSQSYGQRATFQLYIQLKAIVIIAGFLIGALLMKPGSLGPTAKWTLIACTAIVAGGLAWAAIRVGRQIDQRRIDWDPKSRTLHIHGHRWTQPFLSFGAVREEVNLAPGEIQSVRRVRGKAAHLRLTTDRGICDIYCDVQPYDELWDLLESLVET